MQKNVIMSAENMFDSNLILVHGTTISKLLTIINFGVGLRFPKLNDTTKLIRDVKQFANYYWFGAPKIDEKPINIVIGIPEIIIGPAHIPETERGKEQLKYLETILTYYESFPYLDTGEDVEAYKKEEEFKKVIGNERGFNIYVPSYFIKGVIVEDNFIKNPNYIMERSDRDRLIRKTIERMEKEYFERYGKPYVRNITCSEENKFYQGQSFMGSPIFQMESTDDISITMDKEQTSRGTK